MKLKIHEVRILHEKSQVTAVAELIKRVEIPSICTVHDENRDYMYVNE